MGGEQHEPVDHMSAQPSMIAERYASTVLTLRLIADGAGAA